MKRSKKRVGRLPQAQVTLSYEEMAAVDAYARKLRLSRSGFLRNLIVTSLDDVKVLDRIGVVGVVGFVRAMNDSGDLGVLSKVPA